MHLRPEVVRQEWQSSELPQLTIAPSLLLCATSRCSRATDSFSLRKEKRVNSSSFFTGRKNAPLPHRGGIPAHRSGNPPGRPWLSSPCFSAIFSGCIIVSPCGSLTELSINQLNSISFAPFKQQSSSSCWRYGNRQCKSDCVIYFPVALHISFIPHYINTSQKAVRSSINICIKMKF